MSTPMTMQTLRAAPLDNQTQAQIQRMRNRWAIAQLDVPDGGRIVTVGEAPRAAQLRSQRPGVTVLEFAGPPAGFPAGVAADAVVTVGGSYSRPPSAVFWRNLAQLAAPGGLLVAEVVASSPGPGGADAAAVGVRRLLEASGLAVLRCEVVMRPAGGEEEATGVSPVSVGPRLRVVARLAEARA